MQNGSSNKKIWIIVAAALLFTVPVGLWVKHASVMTGQAPENAQNQAQNSQPTQGAQSPMSSPFATSGSKSTSGADHETVSQNGKMTGSPSATGVATQGSTHEAKTVAQAPATPKEPEGCVTLTFHHKKTPGHTSDDACGAHKNLVQLKNAITNLSTVCVRVNRRPVAFQTVKGHSDELLIGAVAGPNSEITVRYCLGKTKCSEDCTVQKDEFMAAIGGAENEGNGQITQWDPADAQKDVDVNAHMDKDIKNELEKLDESRPDSRIASVFNGWVMGTEAPACGTSRQARN